MAYADPLAFERQRVAEIEAKARTADLARRREMIRQEHIARHHADQAAYRNGPIARRIRFRRLLKTMRALRQAFRDGQAGGRERVMEPVHRDGPSLGQRVRETIARAFRASRSRGGNMERERSQARERVQERSQQRQRTRQREQQQTRTSSWAGPEKQKQRAKSRSRGQRVR